MTDPHRTLIPEQAQRAFNQILQHHVNALLDAVAPAVKEIDELWDKVAAALQEAGDQTTAVATGPTPRPPRPPRIDHGVTLPGATTRPSTPRRFHRRRTP